MIRDHDEQGDEKLAELGKRALIQKATDGSQLGLSVTRKQLIAAGTAIVLSVGAFLVAIGKEYL